MKEFVKGHIAAKDKISIQAVFRSRYLLHRHIEEPRISFEIEGLHDLPRGILLLAVFVFFPNRVHNRVVGFDSRQRKYLASVLPERLIQRGVGTDKTGLLSATEKVRAKYAD